MIELVDFYYEESGHDMVRAMESLPDVARDFVYQETERCGDVRYYLENYHVINSEAEGYITLYPFWDSQEIFFEVLYEPLMAAQQVKLICLKARQLGMSTIAEGAIFWKTIRNEGHNTLVIAQEPGQADYLFGMSQLAYSYLPWWMRPEAKYEAKGHYLVFDRKDKAESYTNPGLRSQIFVDAANKVSGLAGVGKTLRAAHMSEFSLWPDPRLLTRGLLPTMNAADLLAIIESTACGRRNHMFTFWKDCVSGKISGWTPVFIESFRVKKYYSIIAPDEKLELTKDEQAMRKKVLEESDFIIPLEHFKWRREKINEYIAMEGDDAIFYEQYPALNWLEAFQGSTLCAFNKKKLNVILSNCRQPEYYGEIDLEADMKTPKFELTKVKKEHHRPANIPLQEGYGGRLRIWKMPEDGESYYIGADVAQGVKGGDFSAAYVMKIGRGPEPDEFVAEFHGWINPTPYARVLAALGYWYGIAEISVECNDIGLKTSLELLKILEYPNLFRWKHYDKLKNFLSDFMGWYTNQKTRELLISAMREAIDDDVISILSEELVEEMQDFGAESIGARFEGQEGHDDRCFTPDTLIRTNRGAIPISEVRCGDSVLSHDAYWHAVNAAGSRFVDEEIVSIKVGGIQKPISCTKEHPILIRERGRKMGPHGSKGRGTVLFGEPRWVTAAGISKGDAVFIPVAPALQPPPLTDSEMYLLGWYFADGSLPSGEKNGLKITFGGDEEASALLVRDIIERMVRSHPTEFFAGVGRKARRVCGSSVTVKRHPSTSSSGKFHGWIDITCTNRWLASWIRKWAGPSGGKFIHESILYGRGTLPFAIGFLEGDGSQKSARRAVDAAQVDRKVLEGIREILLRNGVWCLVGEKANRGLNRLYIGAPWVNKMLSIFSGSKFSPVGRLLEHPIARWDGNGFWVGVSEVKRERYSGEVFNLSVDDSHSYTAGEIAVHNCFASMITRFCAHDSDFGKQAASRPREEPTGDPRIKKDYQNSDFSATQDRHRLHKSNENAYFGGVPAKDEPGPPDGFLEELGIYASIGEAYSDDDGEGWKNL
jgi:hypothetical protein